MFSRQQFIAREAEKDPMCRKSTVTTSSHSLENVHINHTGPCEPWKLPSPK